MIEVDVLVVGGGPAGMNAALAVADAGATVLLVDRFYKLGGQLVKQTHKFFGWADRGAGTRGFHLAEDLAQKVKSHPNIRLLMGHELIGAYADGTYIAATWDAHVKIKAKKAIMCTGAAERMITFENNDLPGVMGAGAVQTLMNEYGVMPGQRYLIVGSGNVGVILAYQLLQAGAQVDAIVDVLPKLGGAYWVHAAKVQRLGVPLLLRRTITGVYGDGRVEKAVTVAVDERFEPVPGTEMEHHVDVVALAVGLMPLADVFQAAGVKTVYVPELGGFVPWHDELGHTTCPDIYVAEDAGGIEEATTASLGGTLAGLTAAKELGYPVDEKAVEQYLKSLESFRDSSLSQKVKEGLNKLRSGEHA
ncbi:FAD-dependent oxidoreductase [Coprothermobacteraceae bacterium]|nr:FAD-dependent oxidoreductase [Coprothermobacteraceae bacterium]